MQPFPYSNFRAFLSPSKKILYMLPLTLHFPSRSWQPLATTDLTASLDLPVLTFHIHRIMVCCDWLLSLKISEGIALHPCCSMYQYFIPFYGQNNIRCMAISLLTYPFISWETFSLYPPFGDCEQCCCEH